MSTIIQPQLSVEELREELRKIGHTAPPDDVLDATFEDDQAAIAAYRQIEEDHQRRYTMTGPDRSQHLSVTHPMEHVLNSLARSRNKYREDRAKLRAEQQTRLPKQIGRTSLNIQAGMIGLSREIRVVFAVPYSEPPIIQLTCTRGRTGFLKSCDENGFVAYVDRGPTELHWLAIPASQVSGYELID